MLNLVTPIDVVMANVAFVAATVDVNIVVAQDTRIDSIQPNEMNPESKTKTFGVHFTMNYELCTMHLLKYRHAFVQLLVLVVLDERGADAEAFLMGACGDEADG